MNRIILAAAVVSALGAQAAVAGETGTINQAGVYEQTMHFYLHPAHGFSHGLALNTNGEHPAVIVHRRDADVGEPAVVTIHLHPALLPRGQQTTILASHL